MKVPKIRDHIMLWWRTGVARWKNFHFGVDASEKHFAAVDQRVLRTFCTYQERDRDSDRGLMDFLLRLLTFRFCFLYDTHQAGFATLLWTDIGGKGDGLLWKVNTKRAGERPW